MILKLMKAAGTPVTLRLKETAHAAPITIGRDKAADIPVDDSKCSRIHCAIRYWDDIFILRDMHSSNGTFVNGNKIEVVQLHPGDVIKIGDTEIRVLSGGTSADVTMMGH